MASYMIKYKGSKLLVLCVVVCISCATALAGAGADASADVNMVSDQTSLEQRLTKRISVEFRKTAIEDVLRIIADQADIDIVKSPKVEGEVTVTLTNVPLEEALNNILSVHGFAYVLSQNMIRVITAAEQVEKPEAMVTKTFEIVYADVTEVVKALEKFKSTNGSISSIQGTSYIMVADAESKIRDITLFIEKIDVMTQQILVEVRIYDVKSKESFDLGVNWHVGRNVPITEINRTNIVGKSGTTSSSDTTERKITDGGATGPTTTTVRTVTDTTDTVDPTNNGVVDTTVTTTSSGTAGTTGDTTTTTTTAGNSSGVASTDEITETTAGTWLNDSFRKSRPFVGGEFDQELGGTLRFGVLNDAVDIQLALNLLHQQIGAKLLANPRILVLDNETAKFEIVSEIPYMQLNQGGGTSQSFGTTEFKEVGVTLEVTPHIAERDKMVRLKLKPSFSVQTGTVNVGDPTQSSSRYPQPVVDRRDADTVLLIKNGTTVVLGGLRKSEVTQDIRKVPVLGDLPLLRKLFRSETESTTTSELLVFITPSIVEEPVMTAAEQQLYEATRFKTPAPGLTRAEKKAEK